VEYSINFRSTFKSGNISMNERMAFRMAIVNALWATMYETHETTTKFDVQLRTVRRPATEKKMKKIIDKYSHILDFADYNVYVVKTNKLYDMIVNLAE
jgi:hypothetical protein